MYVLGTVHLGGSTMQDWNLVGKAGLTTFGWNMTTVGYDILFKVHGQWILKRSFDLAGITLVYNEFSCLTTELLEGCQTHNFNWNVGLQSSSRKPKLGLLKVSNRLHVNLRLTAKLRWANVECPTLHKRLRHFSWFMLSRGSTTLISIITFWGEISVLI